MNSFRPSGPLDPVICLLACKSFSRRRKRLEVLDGFVDIVGGVEWLEEPTIRILPRLNPLTLVVQKMQQRRPDLPTRIQLIPSHTSRLVAFQSVQEQYFVRFGDFAAVIGEVKVHSRGLLAVEGGDEGIYAKEDAFGGLDADGHCVAGEGAGGEDCGVGGGFEVDFDFGQGLVEG